VESNIEELADFRFRKDSLPQFLGGWEDVSKGATSLLKKLREEAKEGRFSVALQTGDPQIFCAVFSALVSSETDLFLFNPSWSQSENEIARKIALPQWVIGNRSDGTIEVITEKFDKKGDDDLEIGFRMMIPTGGTSGKVRFAIHSDATLLASVRAFQDFFGVDRICTHCVLPLYHVSGLMQLVRVMVSRGEIVFGSISNFRESYTSLSAESKSGCFVSLVPTQLHRLLKSESGIDALRNYRAIFVGGGAISNDLLELSRSHKLHLSPTYGMTETASMVATLMPDAFLHGKSGQGFPLPHAQLEITPLNHRVESRPEVGRILIKSDSLFLGYYNENEKTGERYLTNDLGTMGPSGELFVHGRLDRVIISGGENICLNEVEKAFWESNLLQDVVAFGIEDPEWGSRLCVAYVPKEKELGEEEILDRLARHLPKVKLPKSWLKLSSLPRNNAGKVLLDSLVKRLRKVNG
tara:strand:- start:7728 stop:9128 length:1401 start_codon:yes stop_codon:yes gene_type:complete